MPPHSFRRSTLPVGHGSRRIDVPVAWFTPDDATVARAVVWLQHGFARSGPRLADLAGRLAASGHVVVTTSLRSADRRARTVQHLRDNTPFLRDLADSLGGSALTASWTRAGLAGTPPDQLLAVGHSAGGDAAAFVAAVCLTVERPAAGLVLLDPVCSIRGDNLATGVFRLAGRGVPIRIVAAPPTRCNAHGSGVRRVLPLLTGFVGVLLTSGSHVDAEGRTSDRWAQWMCGSAQPDNVAFLQELTDGWLTSMAADSARGHAITPGPADPAVTHRVAAGQARLLWGRDGSVRW